MIEPPSTSELFCVLCRARTEVVDAIVTLLVPLGEVLVVEDKGDEPEGFHGMTVSLGKRVTAWDRVFARLDGTRPVWIIEDDVAAREFAPLVERVRGLKECDLWGCDVTNERLDPSWPWWRKAQPDAGFGPVRWRSFTPLCRLSAWLVGRVLAWQREHGRLMFHEILFASLARTRCDLRVTFPGLFGEFRWRPYVVRSVEGRIVHPVKDPAIALRIMSPSEL